jgi:hypothetical protein
MKLEKVNTKYGSPFGRIAQYNEETTTAKIFQIELCQGYDNGGAYWGMGDNLYAAYGEGFQQYHRAKSLDDAHTKFSLLFPEITFEKDYFQEFFIAYATAALWSSNDDDDIPLDSNFSIDDFDDDALQKLEKDCREFLEKAKDFILNDKRHQNPFERAGHDFWLTRQGHGVGFWDGDWDEPAATELTELSEEFGEFYLYVIDDKIGAE